LEMIQDFKKKPPLLIPRNAPNVHQRPGVSSLRDLMIRELTDVCMYCLYNVPDNVFRGIKFGSSNTNTVNSTRAGIVVARKKGGASRFQITPLLRWRTKERKKPLETLDDHLAPFTPTTDVFPKLQKDLLLLYENVKKLKISLGHIVSPRPTAYKLIVPSMIKTSTIRSSVWAL